MNIKFPMHPVPEGVKPKSSAWHKAVESHGFPLSRHVVHSLNSVSPAKWAELQAESQLAELQRKADYARQMRQEQMAREYGYE